jgi:hypothetical protein
MRREEDEGGGATTREKRRGDRKCSLGGQAGEDRIGKGQ